MVESQIPSELPPDHFASEITRRIKLTQDVSNLCDDFDYGLARIHEGTDLSSFYGEEKLYAFIKLNQSLVELLMQLKPRICDLIKDPRRIKEAVAERKGEDWCQEWEVTSGEDAIRWICAAKGEDKKMVVEQYRRLATALRSPKVIKRFMSLLRDVVLREEHQEDCWLQMRDVLLSKKMEKRFKPIVDKENGSLVLASILASQLSIVAPTYLKPILTAISMLHDKIQHEKLSTVKLSEWFYRQQGTIMIVQMMANPQYEFAVKLPDHILHIEFQGSIGPGIIKDPTAEPFAQESFVGFRVDLGSTRGIVSLHHQFKLLAYLLLLVWSESVVFRDNAQVYAQGSLFTTRTEFKYTRFDADFRVGYPAYQNGVVVEDPSVGLGGKPKLKYVFRDVYEYY